MNILQWAPQEFNASVKFVLVHLVVSFRNANWLNKISDDLLPVQRICRITVGF